MSLYLTLKKYLKNTSHNVSDPCIYLLHFCYNYNHIVDHWVSHLTLPYCLLLPLLIIAVCQQMDNMIRYKLFSQILSTIYGACYSWQMDIVKDIFHSGPLFALDTGMYSKCWWKPGNTRVAEASSYPYQVSWMCKFLG